MTNSSNKYSILYNENNKLIRYTYYTKFCTQEILLDLKPIGGIMLSILQERNTE